MAAVPARTFSRSIEDLCRYDIRLLWLLQGYPPPDHTTLWRFKERMSGNLAHLLQTLNRQLFQAGFLSDEYVFIDGTKIEAASGRYTFVWKKATLKYLERLLGQLPDLWELAEEQVGSDEVSVSMENPICGEERNSYSKTDPDVTFMRMKDDYMRNRHLPLSGRTNAFL